MEDAASLERQGRELLARATTAAELEDARVEALGRSSALTLALRELGVLPAELRGARGQELNRVRGELERLHNGLRERFEASELDDRPLALLARQHVERDVVIDAGAPAVVERAQLLIGLATGCSCAHRG